MSKRTSRTFLKAHNTTLKQLLWGERKPEVVKRRTDLIQDTEASDRLSYYEGLSVTRWFRFVMFFTRKKNRPWFAL